MPKALITGITGQDGSYLAELLLSKGYEVHGLIRRASTFNTGRIDHLYVDPHAPAARMFLHYGDLSDSGQLTNLIYNLQPDEIYLLTLVLQELEQGTGLDVQSTRFLDRFQSDVAFLDEALADYHAALCANPQLPNRLGYLRLLHRVQTGFSALPRTISAS